MEYCWDKWTLDRDRMELRRHGQPVQASRKLILCIRHLIEHRERVVPYDELAQVLWGHADVSNHQLSQIILAARRLLGDDRQTQHAIRTATGKGYHWVAPLLETGSASGRASSGEDTRAPPPGDAPHSTAAEASAERPASPNPRSAGSADRSGPWWTSWTAHAWRSAPARESEGARAPAGAGPAPVGRRHRPLAAAIAACGLAVVLSGSLFLNGHQAPEEATQPTSPGEDAFAPLRKALSMGLYDEVREGLSALPGHLADSQDAHLIAIDLSIQRGRFDRAAEKLDLHLKTAPASGDPIWHAQLLLRQSLLNSRRQTPGAEVFAPADAAVALLQTQEGLPPSIMADALRLRANGYNLTDRFDSALRDLAAALDIHEREGDAHGASKVRATRARTWMRMGRMTDALEELGEVADEFQRQEDKVNEVLARNTMAKIQIESLRWQDAVASTERSMRLLREMQDSDRRYPTMQLRALALVGVGRMREAGALLEDTESSGSQRRNGIIPAIRFLEAGQPEAALDAAARDFHSSRIDTRSNLLLENREGAVLLWVMAAQALAERGQPLPAPSPEQLALLESPTHPVARIAYGRWLLLQADEASAERELKRSLQQAQALNQRLRMVLAAEPLVDLALRREDLTSARRITDDLYAHDPEAMGRDYRFGLMRLRVALAGDDPAAFEEAHRRAMALAGERDLPHGLESLYSERRHRAGGPMWSGPVGSGER